MQEREQLLIKYRAYLEQTHVVFAVTLSTFIKSPMIARSHRMQHFWDQHFIRRVQRRVPVRVKLDHDFIIELSPPKKVFDKRDPNGIPKYRTECYYHYHGLLAVKSEHSHRLWKDGSLNPELHASLTSFQSAGKYRPFKIPSFDFAPAKNLEAWGRYIFKAPDSTYGFV